MPHPVPRSRSILVVGFVLALACLVFTSAAAAESRLYWTNNASGSIGTANRAGGDITQKFFFASPEPYGIAADSSHVYWTDEGTDEVGRAELGGGNVEASLIPAAGEVPEGMAVDGGHVYWANLVGQAIGRANLDGSDPEPKFIQLSAASFPEGVAIEGSHIYWTAAGHGGEIGRSNLAGGEVKEELITGLGGAISALAADSTHLYWSTNVGVGRAAIDGTEVEPNLVTGQTSVGGVTVDDEHVFWASFTTNRIGRAELDGGNVEPSFITGAESPDTITVSQNATTTSGGASSTSLVGGESVKGTATVGGGETTSGTITFALYGPGDETCAAAPMETFAVSVTGNGSYESPAVTPKTTGTYHWVARYGGDAINAPSSSTCAAGAFTVSKNVTTTGAGTNTSVTIGESVNGTSTLSGGGAPSGTVTLSLYGSGDATCAEAALETFPVSVSGNGSYSSPSVTPKAIGTYHWVAEYGGDALNTSSSSECAAGAFTVGKHVTTTGGGVSTTSVTAGGSVHGTANVSGGGTPGGTIDFALYGSGDETCAAAPLKTLAVTVAGNGSYSSPSVIPTALGTYHWVARYSGDALNSPSASECAAGAFTVKAVPVAPVLPVDPPVTPPTTTKTVEPAGPAPGPLLLLEVTRNRDRGIGRISFTVPSAGVLTVSGPGVKTRFTTATGAGSLLATLVPQGSYATRLATNGRGFTEVEVSFQPTVGPALSFTRSVRLVKQGAGGG